MVKISIDPTERVLIIGKTGGGKTVLAKHFLKEIAKKYRVVIIDPKHMWLGKYPKWAKNNEKGTVEKPRLVTSFNPKLSVQCFQPTMPAHRDERLDKLCFDILKQGKTFVFFDELSTVATATQIPDGFSALWTQGRQIEVAAWCATQRPLRIPEIVKSQSEKWFIFDMPGPKNKKEIAEYTDTPDIESTRIPKFVYWYYDQPNMDHAIVRPPLEYKEPKREQS